MGASVGITVGVDGASEYSQSLKNITAETKAFQSELKALQSSFDKNASTWDKTQMTAGVLTDEIGAQYKKLDALREAQSKVAEGSTKYFEYADKINKATDALNQMERQLESLPNHIQAIGEDFGKWGDKIEEAGKKVSKVGDTMTKKVTTPIVGGFTAAIKETSDFDTAMSEVKAIAVTTQEALGRISAEEGIAQFESLRDKAREMGRETVYSATESANAMAYLARAGWDTDQIIADVDGVMALAAADGLDLATTASIVADGVTAFGKSADYASQFADILAMTSAQSNTNVEMLGDSFKYVAPTAASLGYGVEDVALALGLSANAGVKASQAGTGLRQALKNLISPTDKVAMAADEFGISLYNAEGDALPLMDVITELRETFGDLEIAVLDENGELKEGEAIMSEYADSLPISQQEKLQAIVDIFGTRAMPTMLSIINAGEDDFNSLSEAIYNTQGAAQAMADTRLDNLGGDFTLLKDEILDLAISFGDIMVPVLRNDVIPLLRDVIGWFGGLDDSTKEMIVKVGLFAAAVGPVLSIGGRLITGIGTITSGVGGLLKFVGGLATLPAKFAGGASTIAGSFGTVSTAIGAASGGAGIIGSLGSLAAGFAPFLIGGAVVVGLGIGVYEIVKHWDTVKAGIGNLVGWLGEKATGLVDGIKGFFGKVGDFFKGGKDKAVAETKLMSTALGKEYSSMQTESTEKMRNMQNEIALLSKAIKDDTTQQFGYTRDEAVSRIMELKIESAKEMAKAKESIVGEVKNTRTQTTSEFNALSHDAHTWGKDLISNFLEGFKPERIKERASSLAQTIKNILGFSEPSEGPLSDFHTYAPDMMQLFADGIDGNIGVVTGKLQSLGVSMNSIFNGIRDDGFNTGVGTAGNLGSGFEQNMHRIQSAAENMKHSVVSSLAGLASAAHSWGADMANNMANGISSAMNRAANAAAALAGKLSSYLHFSEPDVGPLSDFHTYMPDMMKELAGGIYKNMGLIDRASDTLAAALLPDVETGKISGRSNSTSITNGDIVLNVYGAEGQDVRELARIVEQEITFNMNRRSAAFA